MVECVAVGISARYAVSSIFMVFFANAYRVLRYPSTLIYDNSPFIDVSRNTVARMFMETTKCEKLFLVDTDIVPYRCEGDTCSVFYDVFNYMVERYSSYDVISVYHWSKRFEPNMYRIVRIEKHSEEVYGVESTPLRLEPFSGVHEVDYAGIGITMIDRSVFERVKYPWFRVAHGRYNNTDYTVGEDVYFYIKLKEAGIKAHVTTDILALHLGEYALDVNNVVRPPLFSWRTQ